MATIGKDSRRMVRWLGTVDHLHNLTASLWFKSSNKENHVSYRLIGFFKRINLPS